MQFSCWRYSGRRRAGNTSWRLLPAVACSGRAQFGQVSAVAPHQSIRSSFGCCEVWRPGPSRTNRRCLERERTRTPCRCLTIFRAPNRRSVKGLAVPIGCFGSFSLPEEWRLNRYCLSASLHARVGAKRRRDLEANLAKDILVKRVQIAEEPLHPVASLRWRRRSRRSPTFDLWRMPSIPR